MILRTLRRLWPRRPKVRVISKPDRTLRFISVEFNEGILLEAAAYLAPWLKCREEMAYIAGRTEGDQRVAERVLKFKTIGSLTWVKNIPTWSHRALWGAHKDGLELIAVMHSHLNYGIPRPSWLDWRVAATFRDYNAIGIILSLDGYLRFYGLRPFEVRIKGGKRIKEVRPYVYKILPWPWEAGP